MLALLDERAPKSIRLSIERLGHRVLTLPPHPSLPSPIASHPDALLFFSDRAIYCTGSYFEMAHATLEIISKHLSLPVLLTQEECGMDYPADVLLNAARVGSHLFCLPDATAEKLMADSSLHVCAVKQGYAKCSTIPVAETALITSDRSIEKEARKQGLDVLFVNADNVTLAGYDHGLIGGCASCAPYGGTNTILFSGDQHFPQWNDMYAFSLNHGKRLVPIGDGTPVDVGTIFLL